MAQQFLKHAGRRESGRAALDPFATVMVSSENFAADPLATVMGSSENFAADRLVMVILVCT